MMPDFFLTLGRQLALEVDSAEIRQYVRTTYARTRVEHPVAGIPLDHATIRLNGGSHGVEFNGQSIELDRGAKDSAFQLGFYASNRLLRESFRRNEAWLSFHGAALATPAGALVIVAESGAGKTTLALALLDQGARLLSDEFVFVRKADRIVWGYPRTFMIRRPALALIANPRIHESCRPAEAKVSSKGFDVWHAIDPVAIYGPDVYAPPTPLAGVVLLEAGQPGESRCDAVPSAIAALELARRLNSEATGFGRLSDLATLFAGVRAYRVAFGDVVAVAATLGKAFA
jgi:hypothetical protein